MDTYEKKYKEAQKWIESIYSELSHEQQMEAEAFFPELKESEDVDKKIREEIIATIHLYYGKPLEDEAKEMIAWLKKQEGCEYIKKDWLEHIKQSWYKEGFIDGKYSGGTSKEWTINDAATLKEIIDFLENGTAKLQHDLTKYANWLKIQFTPIEKQGEQKPADKVEPKFHEGDFIKHNKANIICKVISVNSGSYYVENIETNGRIELFNAEQNFHLWTIQDAKDGDVLVASDGSLFIFAKLKDNSAYYHFSLCKNGSKEISDGKHAWETANSCYPATESQRDTLLKAMTDAGYEWDAEKKELRLLITNGDDFFESENCEQKPAEEYSFNIESELFHQLTKEQQELWKKEIEQAYNAGVEASDEWSEEDETKMRAALAFIKSEFPKEGNEEIMEDTIEWFKSLKQRIG